MSRVLIFPAADVHVGDRDRDPVPATPGPRPYEVRVRAGVGGAELLIGHDRHGKPIAELRVPFLPELVASGRIGSAFKAFVRQLDQLEYEPTPDWRFFDES
jgi:hypothetical protein